MPKQRIMFIIWKWKKLPKINKTYISQNPKVKELFEAEGKLHKSLYDEYLVTDSDRFKIIRSNIIYSSVTKPFIYNLLEMYDDADKIIFLHKSHGYDKQFIDEITNRKLTKHIYLIGKGDNYIYYEKAHKGFLNHTGDFQNGIFKEQSSGKNYIRSVIEPENNKLQKKYFKNVWSFYANQLKYKIHELKNNLIRCLLFSNASEITVKVLFKQTKNKNPELLLRIRSFTDYYNKKIFQSNNSDEKTEFMLEEFLLPNNLRFENITDSLNKKQKLDYNKLLTVLNDFTDIEIVVNTKEKANKLTELFDNLLISIKEPIN